MKPFVVESPCSESWNEMRQVAGAARHCASCRKAVFDLSAMTEQQIRGLVSLTDGDFCGRQIIRDGAIVVAPEPVPMRSAWPWRMVTRGAVVAGALASAACEGAATAAPGPTPIVIADRGGDPVPDRPVTPPPTPPIAPAENPDLIMAGGMAPPRAQVNSAVYFARGKSAVQRASASILDDIAATLAANPWIDRIAVVGHASVDDGPAARAEGLAKARAEAVRAYLVKRGIDANRLVVASRAAREPFDPGHGADANAKNRRVEVRMCQGDECP
ncbi:MAG: OmpA family protein [Myxococcota bacterium]